MPAVDSKSVAVKASAVSYSLYEAQPHQHILGSQTRFQELFRGFSFGDEASVRRFTLRKGILSCEDVQCGQLLGDKGRGDDLTVHFLRSLPRNQIALTATAFAHLLGACDTPPSYLEVVANNNGLYHCYSLSDRDGLLTDHYLMVKFPFGPFSNGSLFMHHSVATSKTTCIITATRIQMLVERLVDLFSNSPMPSEVFKPHPFIPVAMLLEHFRIANEDDRNDMDQSVCRIENRSGVSLHNFGSRTRAKIGEYALLQRELHMQDALIAMADHNFSFHTRFAEFVVDEECKLAGVLGEREQADRVRALLELNASMSTWTLEQLRTLEKRLKVQLRVIDSTIAATDALTMIRLARASRSDSNTMKAITILTMVFLPATFVCSLFSMGFFDFGQNNNASTVNNNRDSRIHVAEQFWIYFAVTVPLTLVVLGICAAWLQWSGRKGDDFGETTTAVVKQLD